MGVHRAINYHKETEKAIKRYENVFGEGSFPSFYFEYEFERKIFENIIVESINKCLKNSQDVFDMGIVPLDALETKY